MPTLWRDGRPLTSSLRNDLSVMELCFYNFWSVVGHTEIDSRFAFWLVELVREAFWNLVPLCLLWCIWREWNRRTFEDLDNSGDQMLASFSGTLFYWSRAWGLTTSDSLPSFLSSLSFVTNLLSGFLLCFLFVLFFLYFLGLLYVFFMHRIAVRISNILTYQNKKISSKPR